MEIIIQLPSPNEKFIYSLKTELLKVTQVSFLVKGNTISIVLDKEYLKENIANKISQLLSDYIIENYEKALVNRTIKSNYGYFNSEEISKISSITIKLLDNFEKDFLSSLFTLCRKNMIAKKLFEYFKTSNLIIVDGFVNFSLKDYQKELSDIVDKAVDEFIMEREYDEFIRLLKYFVDIQEPKYETVYIIENNGEYIFQDENKNIINCKDILDIALDVENGETNNGDLLVSYLITLAPSNVILVNKESWKNKELIKTIEEIFPKKDIVTTTKQNKNKLTIVNGRKK